CVPCDSLAKTGETLAEMQKNTGIAPLTPYFLPSTGDSAALHGLAPRFASGPP
ncbi:hypothetical protein HAX54_001672, partial [Datura stramonium]|nr:hypothetical protein [Datura stramonium]